MTEVMLWVSVVIEAAIRLTLFHSCARCEGRDREEPNQRLEHLHTGQTSQATTRTRTAAIKWLTKRWWRWPSPAGPGCRRGSLWAPPWWGGRAARWRAWGRVYRCCWPAGRRSWPAGSAARSTRSTEGERWRERALGKVRLSLCLVVKLYIL